MDATKKVVMHLVGSRVSEYYEGVSSYYASECFKAVMETGTYNHFIAWVHPDGKWSFPEDFSDASKARAERMDIAQAVQRITRESRPDAVIPHMFCLPGMTTFRTLCEALDLPVVGCDGPLMSLSTNKAHSRAIVQLAGVPVPEAELLRRGDRPTMSPPYVLKPCSEDNSMGISHVKEVGDLDKALEEAFTYDSEVLCERFIPLGREIRVAVLEQDDGSLKMLPCIEYFFEPGKSIRSSNDKLSTDSRGVATAPNPATMRKCPAEVDPVLRGKLEHLAMKSHRALGCTDYSLYDVRVDPDGEPFFLEACLYCSFAPKSVIVLMADAAGVTQSEVFESLVNRTIVRHQAKSQGTQLMGMKAAR